MKRPVLLPLLLAVAVPVSSEPPPRAAAPLPLRIAQPLARVIAVGEIAGGRLLITDAKGGAVWLLDSASGALAKFGSAGVGPDQYVQPGGLYGGPGGTTLILDRAQARVLVVTPDANIARTYSVEIKGTRQSADGDWDPWRLDARGYSYFPDRAAGFRRDGAAPPTMPLVRFDPATQQRRTIVELKLPETRTRTTPEGMVLSRAVTGSPADGWGVAPDGRVAVVRAVPYRVEWISPGGAIVKGPEIAVDVIPMTEADRDAFRQKYARGGGAAVGVQGASGGGGMTGMEPEFAATKAPFPAEDVFMAPDAQVWVNRSRPAGATTAVYDVFDERGRRIDRLEFPGGSRIVGFGAGAVYMREEAGTGTVVLKKYRRPAAQ